MRLWKLGPDGEPTGEVYECQGVGVASWRMPDDEPLPSLWTTAQAKMEFVITEPQFLDVLLLLAGPEAVAEYVQHETALAVWDNEGGWCGA